MAHAELIDYAYPTIRAEQALRAMQKALLEQKHEEALAHALDAIVETKLAYNAIRHKMESTHA